MKVLTSDRTDVLIVRLWLEASHETGLRARITQTLGTTASEQPVAVASSADGICAVVKEWVDAFADPGGSMISRGDPAGRT